MKKVFMMLAVAMLSIATLHAQQDPVHRPMTEQERKMMKEKHEAYMNQFGLTEQQKKDVRALDAMYGEKLKAVHEDKTLTPEARTAKIKMLHDERNEKLKAIVGPEKYQQMEEKREEMKEMKKERKDMEKVKMKEMKPKNTTNP